MANPKNRPIFSQSHVALREAVITCYNHITHFRGISLFYLFDSFWGLLKGITPSISAVLGTSADA